jgi:hypothetical protein
MKRAISALVVLLLAIGAAGAAHAAEPGRATRPMRSALADGFEVVPGTRLVGTVFQKPTRTGLNQWTALLLVDRDPVGVYDAYVAQARKLGIPLPGSGAVRSWDGWIPCNLDLGNRTMPLGTVDPIDAEALECYGFAAAVDANIETYAQLSVRWGGATHHAYLTVSHAPRSSDYATEDAGAARIEPPAQLPKRSRQRSAKEPGETFGAPNDGFYLAYKRPRLEVGSRLAAPEAFSIASKDFVAVLRIDGDVDRVLRRYARQLGGGETVVQHASTIDGEAVAFLITAPFGGGSGEMLADPTGRWVLVQTESD